MSYWIKNGQTVKQRVLNSEAGQKQHKKARSLHLINVHRMAHIKRIRLIKLNQTHSSKWLTFFEKPGTGTASHGLSQKFGPQKESVVVCSPYVLQQLHVTFWWKVETAGIMLLHVCRKYNATKWRIHTIMNCKYTQLQPAVTASVGRRRQQTSLVTVVYRSSCLPSTTTFHHQSLCVWRVVAGVPKGMQKVLDGWQTEQLTYVKRRLSLLHQSILELEPLELLVQQQSLLQNTLLLLRVVAVWLSGNIVGRVNKVTLCRARLVLRRVIVHGYTILVSHQGQLSLPSFGWLGGVTVRMSDLRSSGRAFNSKLGRYKAT